MSEHTTNLLAVGCIVRDGKIFIAKRAKTKGMFPDRYELIGGHLELGEQPQEALVREVKEELGIDVTVGQPVHAFTEQVGEVFYMEVIYICYLKNPTDEPTLDSAEHSEAHWITVEEIGKFDKEDEETIALRKAFELIGESK